LIRALWFVLLILSALFLTKMAALGQFSPLDNVPVFRQIFAGTRMQRLP
jgi:hypothetical protein